MCSRRVLTLGGSIAVTLLFVGTALADLTKDEQKCIDGYNNKLRLVSQQAGKDYRTCVKNGTKGTPGVETCITGDGPGKIAGKETKVSELYPAKCTGSEPIQQGAATGNAAHRQGPLDLTHDILGDPVLDATVDTGDKAIAKCQDKMVQRAGQAFTEIVKGHRKCKKDNMKTGAVDSSATLDATCGTFAQVDVGSKATGKLTKLSGDVAAACNGLTIADIAPGECAGAANSNALGVCLVARTRCRACETLNTADGQSMDCDLFDDTIANGSCGQVVHVCNLANTSALNLGTTALSLPLTPTGSLDISCGAPDGNGVASCTCTVGSFGAVVIPGLGDVCVNAASGCTPGKIDCDGGSALDNSLVADHNIGACTGDSDCETQCNSYCGGISSTAISYGCEGYCQGGANDGNACTSDSQCSGGQCSGGEPVAHAGVCNCSCQAQGLGAAAGAGNMACEIGTQINVENVGSPTGICGDAAPQIQLPPVCGGVTTTNSSGGILHAGNDTTPPLTTVPPYGTLVNPPNGIGTYPNMQTGAGISCTNLDADALTGLKLVGHLAFPDSTLGDILSMNAFVCQ